MGEEFNEIKIKAKKTLKKLIFLNHNQADGESRESYIHCCGLSYIMIKYL